MYVLPAFEETGLSKLHDLIEQYSFGVLVSQVGGLPFATHLPFLLERNAGPNGTLIGHTARTNPQCSSAGDQTVLAIFSGPHAYISPTYYQAENVVPTWNYVVVHVTGKIQTIDDAPSLLEIVRKTTVFYERSMPTPWTFKGESTFSERMISQITGFRIEIESIEGKWKMNQNHPVERQENVVQALRERGGENSVAVANLMQQRIDRIAAEARHEPS